MSSSGSAGPDGDQATAKKVHQPASSPSAPSTPYAGTHRSDPTGVVRFLGGATISRTPWKMPRSAGSAISSKTTPHTSQPQTMPSLVMKANSRKFQPSEPKSAPYIGISRFGAFTELAAKAPPIAETIITGMPRAIRPAPSGQGWALTYGPPSAQAPPTYITARIARYTHVRQIPSSSTHTTSTMQVRYDAVPRRASTLAVWLTGLTVADVLEASTELVARLTAVVPRGVAPGALTLVIVSVVLTGCGGGGDPNDPDDESPTAAASEDAEVPEACAVLTQVEVSEAVGTDVGPGRGSSGPVAAGGSQSTCEWFSVQHPADTAKLTIYSETTAADAIRDAAPDGEQLPGVGDDAFVGDLASVWVYQGELSFMAQWYSMAAADEESLPRSEALARLAADRL